MKEWTCKQSGNQCKRWPTWSSISHIWLLNEQSIQVFASACFIHIARLFLALNCAEHPLPACLKVSECHEPGISKTQTVTEGYEIKEKEQKRQRQDLPSPSSPSIRQQSGGLLVPFRTTLASQRRREHIFSPRVKPSITRSRALVMASMPNSVGENVTDKGGLGCKVQTDGWANAHTLFG